MKSRITIEVDFNNNNQPVIQILQTNDSDDVRDRLLSAFCQQFGGSSWCNIKWVSQAPDNPNQNTFFNRIYITPVLPDDFKEQAKIMLEQDKINEQYKNEGSKVRN